MWVYLCGSVGKRLATIRFDGLVVVDHPSRDEVSSSASLSGCMDKKRQHEATKHSVE